MLWTQFDVVTTEEASDAVAHLLQEMGSHGVQIQDRPPTVRLIAFFPTDDRIGERVRHLQRLLRELQGWGVPVEPAEIELARVEDADWANAWKSAFPPQRIGRHWLIAPSWEPITPRPHERLIVLDPGMAFGTGYHPTTQLALCLIEDAMRGGEQVFDLGTGSGILAIAAAKLGARSVLATDIDATAIPIAQENARKNGVAGRIRFRQGDRFKGVEGIYDLIVANILAKVILPMIPECPRFLGPGGNLILSGILRAEDGWIRQALSRAGLQCIRTREQDEWIAYLARRTDGHSEGRKGYD